MLGKKIQQLRKENGMSQEQLASELTISRQAISKWELGESMPDTENIVQLSKLFGVSTDYLLINECESDKDSSLIPDLVNVKETETLPDNTDGGDAKGFSIKQFIRKPALWIIVVAAIVTLPICALLANEVLKTRSFQDLRTYSDYSDSVADSPALAKEAETIQETSPSVIKSASITYGKGPVNDFTLKVGDSIALSVIAESTNYGYDNIVWHSSDQKIFEVELTNSTGTEACVTAMSRWTAMLTVTIGDVQTQCAVRVKTK